MSDLFVAFITGLTTGGLSCLAVQGGLLASSLANQLEKDAAAGLGKNKHIAQPIIWFLLAKLMAYTMVGFLLGSLGSVFELSPAARAVLQIAIGIFMVGSALRMLNVHPIFRYFVFEPPSFITRAIRRTAKNNSSALTPFLLGLMTILIPCGITQVMMAAAIASGDALKGASLMFAFTLGTSPVFFAVAYFTTRLGATLEKYFMKGVAVVVLVLGLITVNTGLNLMGSPYSFDAVASRVLPAQASGFLAGVGLQNTTGPQAGCAHQDANTAKQNAVGSCSMMSNGNAANQAGPVLPAPAGPTAPQPAARSAELLINVKSHGYEPNLIHAPANQPVKLKLISQDTYSCALAFVIPSLNIQKMLQPTDSVVIELPAQQAGSTLPFSCSMGMYTGKIIFDL
jgi:sulfite exporter TauE/SafE